MADFSSWTGKFSATKNGTHDSARVVKRPRDSLVCSQCRRSKLRCDRARPCSSCVKRDEAQLCSYARQAGPNGEINSNYVAEDRLLHLESLVMRLIQSQTADHSHDNATVTGLLTASASPHDHGEVAARSKSEEAGGPRYVGSTHWSAILSDINELKVVLGNYMDSQLPTQPLTNDAYLGGELIFGSLNTYNVPQIIAEYLPSKLEVDRLVGVYFQEETMVTPLMHTDQFQRQYKDFWSSMTSANPLWLSMLFSICYIASMIESVPDAAHAPINKGVAGNPSFHRAAGQCLVLGEYYRPQKYTLEALVIYSYCKNLTTLDSSREAASILGIAVRIAFELGYHRDPETFGPFTVFEGEMRRRTWAVCKQLDIMISFQFGLPSNIRLDECDTRSPRHLLDSDFDEDTEVLPTPRSEDDPIRLLLFIVKDRQMAYFGKVCRNALFSKEIPEDEILLLDREMREMHAAVPAALRTRPLSDSVTDAPFLIMSRIYVEFLHLKSLCVLHRRYMARGNAFSTSTCVEAGIKLVSQFIDMYQGFLPGRQLHAQWWRFSNFNVNDFLLATMVLCLAIHLRRKKRAPNAAIDAAKESEVLKLLDQSLMICTDLSSISRDALRVCNAISLTLKGVVSSDEDKILSAQGPPLAPHASDSLMSVDQPPVADSSFSSYPRQSFSLGDDASLRMLDPFNFMNNDVYDVDWMMLGQDVLNDSNFAAS